jgi:hypothetical protein
MWRRILPSRGLFRCGSVPWLPHDVTACFACFRMDLDGHWSPMRQLGAIAVSRASPKLTHGADGHQIIRLVRVYPIP